MLHPVNSKTHTIKAIHKIRVYKIEYLGKTRIHSICQFANFIK